MRTPNIRTNHVVIPKIYAYTTPGVTYHDGWVKIGYTEADDVNVRIKQQCHTANIAWILAWQGNAVYEGSHDTFIDKAFHAYLNKLGYQQEAHTEWFRIGTDESRMKFYDFRENRGFVKGKPTQQYQLREDSQGEAVRKTIESFRNSPESEYLWNAKPRFGKTLAVYDLCMKMQFRNVLVVTNRPAIADSWYFRVEHGRFVHDESVDKWLDALSRQARYPFSTEALRNEIRHSFWLLNRVDSAKALAKKLRDTQRHPEFASIEIVVAAGDGKTDNDEIIEDESSLMRVRKAIAEHPQGTITLSVGQLTTGVTVPEWTAVLILSNMKSPAQYMQTAFRAQTPHLYIDADGRYHRKENAYVFDFDPARTLSIYEEMANGLTAETASGGGDIDTRKAHIRELLNFFPVIGEDEQGEMEALDAEQVMLIPRRIRSKEVVRSGFMSNFLFANISNIYGCPAGVISIINKFDAIKESKKNSINTDDVEQLSHEIDADGNAQPSANQVAERQARLFGDKIYGEPKEAVDNIIEESFERYSQAKEKKGKSAEEQMIDSVSEQLTSVLLTHAKEHEESKEEALSKRNQGLAAVRIKKAVNEQIGKHCHQAAVEKNTLDHQCKEECVGKTTQEQHDIRKRYEAEKQVIDKELEKTVQGKSKELLEKSAEIVAETYEQQRIDVKKSDVNEVVRNHLRGFSRTIPSFLMAYGDEETTLQNFDQAIPEEVFLEVTSVTKAQFRLLRDGGEFVNEETGKTENSPGHFFDEVVFNDSVKEFMALRKRLANYFEPSNKEDIFNYIPAQRTNQIFTPKEVVRKMVDLLEEENPGCFDDPRKTFADLYMKSGQYITEIVKRLYNSQGLKKAFPDSEKRIRHIFKHQVYGLAPTECIYRISLRYILGFDDTIHIDEADHHLRQADSLPAAKAGTIEEFLDEVF